MRDTQAEIAQLVEHIHGKDEVVGSIPTLGSLFQSGILCYKKGKPE
jgi:hypothetical protein